jgi:hypothetical protein
MTALVRQAAAAAITLAVLGLAGCIAPAAHLDASTDWNTGDGDSARTPPAASVQNGRDRSAQAKPQPAATP